MNKDAVAYAEVCGFQTTMMSGIITKRVVIRGQPRLSASGGKTGSTRGKGLFTSIPAAAAAAAASSAIAAAKLPAAAAAAAADTIGISKAKTSGADAN